MILGGKDGWCCVGSEAVLCLSANENRRINYGFINTCYRNAHGYICLSAIKGRAEAG